MIIETILKYKKVLLIIGHTGSGKTKLAQLLLKEFNYQIIEYNSSDIRSQKKMGEAIKKHWHLEMWLICLMIIINRSEF